MKKREEKTQNKYNKYNYKMAQDFTKWISSCFENLSTEDLNHRIIVVGIIGNETADGLKFELINDYFKKTIFYDAFDTKFTNDNDENYISVRKFFF